MKMLAKNASSHLVDEVISKARDEADIDCISNTCKE